MGQSIQEYYRQYPTLQTYFRSYPFNFFKGGLSQILIGPFLNIFSHIFSRNVPSQTFDIVQNMLLCKRQYCDMDI